MITRKRQLLIWCFLYIFRNGPPHIRDIIGQQKTQFSSLNLGVLFCSNLPFLTYYHNNRLHMKAQLLFHMGKGGGKVKSSTCTTQPHDRNSCEAVKVALFIQPTHHQQYQ